MRRFRVPLAAALSVLLMLSACGGGGGSGSSGGGGGTANLAPVANAGASQTVGAGALVVLNGSGSSDADGTVDHSLPTTRTTVTLEALPDGGTRMTVVSSFPTREAMQQLLEMGVEEGMLSAMGQIEALLVG